LAEAGYPPLLIWIISGLILLIKIKIRKKLYKANNLVFFNKRPIAAIPFFRVLLKPETSKLYNVVENSKRKSGILFTFELNLLFTSFW